MRIPSFVLFLVMALTHSLHSAENNAHLMIGWGTADITPERDVVIAGGTSARLSNGVDDPLTVTALALEAPYQKNQCPLILISCDMRQIPDAYRDGVRAALAKSLPEVPAESIILNATHSHTAPPLGSFEGFGVKFDAMMEEEYQQFAINRIASAAEQAWKDREAGGVSFGLAHATIGQNRLLAYHSGKSKMYGKSDTPDFSHVEGYEDHSVNILATWDKAGELTGLLINVAMPSQVELSTKLSADYWHNVREELRSRLGSKLFILPQCSAAGDQSPKVLADIKAEERMEKLTGKNRKQTIGIRLANAVESIFPVLKDNIEWRPTLAEHSELVPLTRRNLEEADFTAAKAAQERYAQEYKTLMAQLDKNPELLNKREWYIETTAVYRRMRQGELVMQRYEAQKKEPHFMAELRAIRIGDMAIVTNPFELYVDFGMQIKSRSKAAQTFIVQLAGRGTYVPTVRSIAGGAYGATPSTTEIGPEGGADLVNWTVDTIAALWPESQPTHK